MVHKLGSDVGSRISIGIINYSVETLIYPLPEYHGGCSSAEGGEEVEAVGRD